MHTYKLTYFDLHALGEPIRLLFTYGGIQFEDVRVALKDWPTMDKTKFPLGQLPVLEIDGKKYWQCRAICRYLAKQVNLAGKTDMENFMIDMAVDTIEDLRLKMTVWAFEQDVTIREQKYQQFKKETLPFFLQKMDHMVKENKGYFALGRLTWADIYFFSVMDYINFFSKEDITVNHVNLKMVVNHVKAVPQLKKWIDHRVKTDF